MKTLFSFCLSIVVLVLFTANANAERTRPNWCANNLNAQERMICNDPNLSQLDVTMVAIYSTMRAGSPRQQSANLKAAQDAWFVYRKSCGTNTACINHRYVNRINELVGQQPQFVNPQLLAQRAVRGRVFRSPELRTVYTDRTYLSSDIQTGISQKRNADGTPAITILPYQIDPSLALRDQLNTIEGRLYAAVADAFSAAGLTTYDGLINGLDTNQRIDQHLFALFGQ